MIWRSIYVRPRQSEMQTMVHSNDGFEIAEADLKIRGEGDVLGLQQSGLPKFLIADIETQKYLLEIARDDSRMLLESDPGLTTSRGTAVRDLLYLMDLQRSLAYIRVG